MAGFNLGFSLAQAGCKLRALNLIVSLQVKGLQYYEPLHELFNNVVCATSKASDQPAYTRSLIRAFASR